MINISLSELATIVSGQLLMIDKCLSQEKNISEVTIDSRSVKPNSLFIALQGEHFDGHDFVQQAIEAGANAILVNRILAVSVPQIVVENTRLAFAKIASWLRGQVDTHVIALTGSSGKTSVKEMTATILQQCGSVLYTEGNYNNDIGVPLTLLRLTPKHKFAVIEQGANHIGEIAYTSKLVRPEAALVNNLAQAHLEGFGSLAGVAQAKGEIFNNLVAGGTAIINQDSNDIVKWQDKLIDKCIWRFSINENSDADFYASNICLLPTKTTFILHSPQGEIAISLPLAGLHAVANALAASALSMSVGANLENIQQGLALVKPVKGRLYPIELAPGKYLLDDSYNANVGSMSAAIDVLNAMPGYRVMVVGDMGELGQYAESCHFQVGQLLRDSKVDHVISVGQLSRLISEGSQKGQHLTSKKDVITHLQILLSTYNNITILIKGSRSAGMEQIILGLKESK